jgi:hypothetical protein
MKQLLNLSSAKLQRVAALKRKIETLEARLAQMIGEDAAPSTSSATVKQRKMSAAGRRAISRAAKARWAKIKAATKKMGR